ncbi:MAG: thioredoxin family protein [Anaerolineales bacterium]|nr:thioredoxin family protein [Anaerolineales bacterium]
MSELLNEEVKDQIRQLFAGLEEPVKVLFFGEKTGCDYCDDTRQLVEEVAALSEKLAMEEYDLEDDAEISQQYRVDKTPGLVITQSNGADPKDFGIRFAGIPSGHEFSSLIQDILLVSKQDSGLSQETRQFLAELTQPVLLQVFVTPTCPYCPSAVMLAHQMALESPMVDAEMVEAMEFYELSEQHQVSGVPHTVINEGASSVVGSVPEGQLLAEIKKALVE